jgi:hypothetical protein
VTRRHRRAHGSLGREGAGRAGGALGPRRRRRRSGWVFRLMALGAMAVGGILLAGSGPRVALTTSGPALAALAATPPGVRLVAARATGPDWSSRLAWRQGGLWPQHPAPAGRRLTVSVTLRAPSWVGGLPWGETRAEATRQAPPNPEPARRSETLLYGLPLLIRLTAPATTVTARADGVPLPVHRFRDEDDVWSAALPASIQAETTGTVEIETQAERWETPSRPQAVFWSEVPLGSLLRLQQMLADLGYLPLRWQPALPSRCRCRLALLQPPAGSFHWRWPDVPAPLRALWSPGTDNLITQGAVMAFDRIQGLPLLPYATPAMWRDLVLAWEDKAQDPHAYTYVHVSETLPESLYLWRDGQVVLRSLVNTAKPPAHTHQGTFIVHLRFRRQSMHGFGPTGQPYFYPDVPWVSYFQGNDALHGFVRKAYGFPQSAGCVELPLPTARRLWHLIHYGTLVTVAPPAAATAT